MGHVVIRGATVLSQDDEIGELVGDVEVRDGEIVAVGAGLATAGAEEIDAAGMVAIPGFVDTHWHLWGTLLRGVIGDGRAEGWFARKGKLAPHMSPEDMFNGVMLGAADGLATGVTTIHDWAHNVLSPDHADANLRAHKELGTRVHFTYGAPSAHPSLSREEMAAQGALPPDQAMDVADAVRVREQWSGEFGGLLSVGVNVRGPARSDEAVYREEWRQARDAGLPIAMHCAGTEAEVRRIRQVKLLEADGLLGPDVLLAHCLFLDEEERGLLAARGVPVTFSPLSELRLAMGFPILAQLREDGVQVSLSLDTTAIAGAADPFAAMRVALGISNSARGDATEVTPRDMLRVATLAGAEALGLGDRVGSITPGKRADIVLVRTRTLNAAPVVDPAVAVVHSALPSDVDTVLVDGRVVKRDGRLTTVEPEAVIGRAEVSLRGVCGRAGFEMTGLQSEGSAAWRSA
ncbi:amidohydrolase family protein [Conexibacter woesei]|uniref:Amidohydrolase n=1 Tax=Conexibacter woesei (strain DSM 14684 / CCUG 47730 / CIP 108061 / JCM 11494 / NBRC 100937 / ID131577) TaxID=469383 RepID=D3F4M5_CONWI|nr:amidohydrolase family protein [Conexibacter woesei]ADB52482.1 amidohydrolase [Conexibacter woesei DSM 14684]